jgi:hypothetical protein
MAVFSTFFCNSQHPFTSLSCRLFEFVMRMLATGQNCLPAAGIGAMAQQLAARLPADSIYTGAPSSFRRLLLTYGCSAYRF